MQKQRDWLWKATAWVLGSVSMHSGLSLFKQLKNLTKYMVGGRPSIKVSLFALPSIYSLASSGPPHRSLFPTSHPNF